MHTPTFPQRTQSTTRAATITITALIIGMALGACSKTETASTDVRPALAYKIGSAAGTDIDVYSGEIRARHEVDHAFRVGGKIAKRLVDAGASVRRGQPLAELDPQDVKLAADAARAQVTAQQTEAEFADAELKRFRDLFTKGFVSQSALDQKINVANAARARLDAQKASANVSINQAGYATLIAQQDGVVTQVLAEAGQVVSQGQPILKLADPQELELAISVPESRVAEFRGKNAGRAIRVHLWSNPDNAFEGRIREVAGAADPVTRTFATRISVASGQKGAGIGLGMSAFAAFISQDAAGTFSVPLSALFAKGSVVGVWVIAGDGKVTLKPVTVVQYRETTALVKSDVVKPGDTIVAAGVHKLRDGEVVKPLVDTQVKGDGKVAMVPDASGALPTVAALPPATGGATFNNRMTR